MLHPVKKRTNIKMMQCFNYQADDTLNTRVSTCYSWTRDTCIYAMFYRDEFCSQMLTDSNSYFLLQKSQIVLENGINPRVFLMQKSLANFKINFSAIFLQNIPISSHFVCFISIRIETLGDQRFLSVHLLKQAPTGHCSTTTNLTQSSLRISS